MASLAQNKINSAAIIWYSSIAGLLGGLLLFIGDLMFYLGPIPEHVDYKVMNIVPVPIENMANVEDWRLVTTVICALFSSWLYALGAFALYYLFKQSNKTLAILSAVLFGFVAIGIGIVHVLYFAAGISAKNAYMMGADYHTAVSASFLSIFTFELLAYIIIVPAFVLTIIYYFLVLRKQSLLPKWSVLFFPTTIIIAQYLVDLLPKSLFKIILLGGSINLSMILYFLSLVIMFYRKKIFLNEASK